MFNFFKKREKEVWGLVRTLTYTSVWRLRDSVGKELKNEPCDIYYHLYESNLANRRCEIKSTVTLSSESTVMAKSMNTKLYQEKIYRWLNGRHDPEIPRYTDIPGEDTFNSIKGKI